MMQLPEPLPLKPITPELELDTAFLPPLLRDLVDGLSLQFQIDPVIPFASALGCIATATRGKITSMVSRSSWGEHSSFYICSLAITGDGKSNVMSWLTKPIFNFEVQLQDAERKRFNLQNAEHEIAQERLKAVKTSLANPKKSKSVTNQASQADLHTAIDEVSNTKPKPIPEIMCGGDVTNDRLTEMLQAHQNLSITEAEGEIFSHLSGKRHNTGSAYETMLKAFTGERIKTHRIGRSDGSVDGAHLVICTSVQPSVWHELMKDPLAGSRGVIGRFLVVVADSKIGHRDTTAHRRYPIGDDLLQRWTEIVNQLLNTDRARVLEMSASGEVMFDTFRAQWESKLIDQENQLQGFGTRMPGLMMRLATLLTLAENPLADGIDDHNLESAIYLADFFLAHRKRADDVLDRAKTDEQRILDKIAPWMRKHQDVSDVNSAFSFSTSDLHNQIKSQTWAKDGKIEAVRNALANLERWCWLESIDNDRWQPRADLLNRRW